MEFLIKTGHVVHCRTLSCTKMFSLGTPLYFHIEGNSIIMSTERTSETRWTNKVVSYGGVAKNLFCIPFEAAELIFPDYKTKSTDYSLYQIDEKTYRIARQKLEERRMMTARPTSAFPGMVRGYRHLYLTASQRNQLGITPCTQRTSHPQPIKITMDVTNRTQLRVEPVKTQADVELPTMRELLKALGRDEFYRQPRTFLSSYQHCLILPKEFIVRGNVGEKDQLPIHQDGRAFIIEGHPYQCDICAAVEPASKSRARNTNVCNECASVMEATSTIVQRNGSIKKSLKESKKRLEKAEKLISSIEMEAIKHA